MVIATLVGQRLKEEADLAWVQRWRFVWDINGDGTVTISDVYLWLSWVFFAPGYLVLLLMMQTLPTVALFLELTPNSLSGTLSGVLSAIAWLFAFGAVGA